MKLGLVAIKARAEYSASLVKIRGYDPYRLVENVTALASDVLALLERVAELEAELSAAQDVVQTYTGHRE